MWRRLTTQQREEAERRIEFVGRWLRNDEPAQSVTEDLLGHQIRSLLVRLRIAVARGRKDESERLTLALEACVAELYAERIRRKR